MGPGFRRQPESISGRPPDLDVLVLCGGRQECLAHLRPVGGAGASKRERGPFPDARARVELEPVEQGRDRSRVS
jgi:hypothetical protein